MYEHLKWKLKDPYKCCDVCVELIMTKRKRDIFTVIDSINNWFEASAHNTSPLQDSEGDADHLVNSSTSADQVPANGLVAEIPRSTNTSEPWAEAFYVPSHSSDSSIGPGPQAEVGDRLIPAFEALHPPAAGAGYIPAPEGSTKDISHERVQTTGYNPSTGEATGPAPGIEEEKERAIAAFWRLLADVGYDTW